MDNSRKLCLLAITALCAPVGCSGVDENGTQTSFDASADTSSSKDSPVSEAIGSDSISETSLADIVSDTTTEGSLVDVVREPIEETPLTDLAYEATHHPDDILKASPGGVLIAPGLLQCLDLVRVSKDGSSNPVDPSVESITFEFSEEGIARESEPGDCTGTGLIGLRTGVGQVTITVGTAVDSVWTRVPIEVVTASYGLRMGSQTVRKGGSVVFNGGGVLCQGSCPQLLTDSTLPATVEYVHRFLTLTTANPQMARLTYDDADRVYHLEGIEGGKTSALGSYAVPDQPAIDLAAVDIFVSANPQINDINCINLREKQASPRTVCSGAVHPLTSGGPCYVPEAVLNFVDSDINASWLETWTEGVQWDAQGKLWLDTTQLPIRVCPAATGSGDGTVTACYDGECANLYEAVTDSAKSYALSAQVLEPITGPGDNACGKVSVLLAGSDSPPVDIVASGAIRWGIGSIPGSTLMVAQPTVTDSGQLCFRASTTGGPPEMTPVQVPVHIEWGPAQTDTTMEMSFFTGAW